MKSNLQHTNTGLSFLLGLLSFLYFWAFYPSHLHFYEQMQLFLLTPDYFLHLIIFPGGLSDYLSHAITQFFYYPMLGALLISMLLVALQRMLALLSRSFGRNPALELLTFIPSVYFWCLLGSENCLLSGIVSVLIVLPFVWGYLHIKSHRSRLLYAALMIPLLYWAVGIPFLLFPLFVLSYEILCRKTALRSALMLIGLFLILSVAFPLLARCTVLSDLSYRDYLGGEFWRTTSILPFRLILFWLLCLMPVVFRFLPYILPASRKGWLCLSILSIAILVVGAVFTRLAVEADREEIMAYDYFARNRQWKEAINFADYHNPTAPLSIAVLNLSLCKENRMGDLFHYYQCGTKGLFPKLTQDRLTRFMLSEIYYQLGFLNMAQHLSLETEMFECQRHIRSIKRLCEISLIEGDTATAARYLDVLSHTLFYRTWAKEILHQLKEGTVLQQNPEWQRLSILSSGRGITYQPKHIDGMLFSQWKLHWNNSEIYDYLLSYELLAKNRINFEEFYKMGAAHRMNQNPIPLSYQEALLDFWTTANDNPSQTIPYSINASVVSDYRTFKSLVKSYRNPKSMLSPQFSDTYWFYYHYVK